MSSAIVLNEKLENVGALALPSSFEEIHSHNLYLYVKSYQAALRSNTANTKTKGEVSGGGKKPWAQKGRGGARAGSRRSPVWVGGGAAFGPKANKNYDLKVIGVAIPFAVGSNQRVRKAVELYNQGITTRGYTGQIVDFQLGITPGSVGLIMRF